MIGISEISVLIHLFLFFYALVLILLVFGWYKVRNTDHSKESSFGEFSILIPFRNEAKRLPILIDSLKTQSFNNDLNSIVFVNDHSTDNSISILKGIESNLPIKVLELKETIGKKEALKLGWTQIESPWIVQLDADVKLPNNWFLDLLKVPKNNGLCILPLEFTAKTFFQKIFAFEFMSISVMTFGSQGLGHPLMANAAHLLYKNKDLVQVSQSQKWLRTDSGDDLALLEHYKEIHSVSASLIPGLSISTSSENSFSSICAQRLRWAAKNGSNSTLSSRLLALFMIFSNILFILSMYQICFGEIQTSIPVFHIYVITKFILDLFFMLPALSYFKKIDWIFYYPILAIFYPFYVLFIFIFSFRKRGEWKGRSIELN